MVLGISVCMDAVYLYLSIQPCSCFLSVTCMMLRRRQEYPCPSVTLLVSPSHQGAVPAVGLHVVFRAHIALERSLGYAQCSN